MTSFKPHGKVLLGAPHSRAALQKSLKEWKALPHAETQRRREENNILGAPHSRAALQKPLKASRISQTKCLIFLSSFFVLKFHADKLRALLEKVAWARRREENNILGAPHSRAALQKSLEEFKILPHAETQSRRGIEYEIGYIFYLIGLILPFSVFLLSPFSFLLFKPLTESQRHGVFFREHRHPAGNINSQITIDRIYMLHRNLFPSAPLRLCERPFPNEFCSNKYWGKE